MAMNSKPGWTYPDWRCIAPKIPIAINYCWNLVLSCGTSQPTTQHNTLPKSSSGFASVPFTIDRASETDENAKETPKQEEVVRMLVDDIREVSYNVRKQKGALEVVAGYEMDCATGRDNCPKNGV
jgi:hypothetical protein